MIDSGKFSSVFLVFMLGFYKFFYQKIWKGLFFTALFFKKDV